MNHFENRPERQPYTQGYTPADDHPFLDFLVRFVCWCVAITAGVGLGLPLVQHAAHWVLGGR